MHAREFCIWGINYDDIDAELSMCGNVFPKEIMNAHFCQMLSIFLLRE